MAPVTVTELNIQNVPYVESPASIAENSFVTKNARKRKSARGVAGVIQFEKIKIIIENDLVYFQRENSNN